MNLSTLPGAPEHEAAATSTVEPKVESNAVLASGAAIAIAGVAAATLLSARPARAVSPALTFNNIPGQGDIKVLNYALSLEALETDLYVQAIMRLTTGGTNALGVRILGLKVPESQPDVLFFRKFGKVEQQHRDFLRRALGSEAITAPGKPLANAKFDFGMEKLSRQQVLGLILQAEATGVRAYLGALPLLATKTYVQTAAAIQGTEARHTTVITQISNQLFDTRLDVAPLPRERFSGVYNPRVPNQGNDGRDGTQEPNVVLASISPFIVLDR